MIERDAGFSLFYMGHQLWAFYFAADLRLPGQRVGWHWGFGAAGIA